MRAKPGDRFATVTLWEIGLVNDTAAFQAPSSLECIEKVVRSTGIVQFATVPEERSELDSHI